MKQPVDLIGLYEAILQITYSGTIQQLMDTVYACTGVPILAVDVAYNVLGIAPADKTGEYTWDYLLEKRGFDTEHTVMEFAAGTMQSVEGQHAPYIIDWDKNAELPKILGLIRINDTVEGYVSMQCRKGEADETLIKVMDMVQKACSIMFRHSAKETDKTYIHVKAFAAQLFSGQIKTRRDIELWDHSTGFCPMGRFCCYAVRVGGTNPKMVLPRIKRSLVSVFPNYLSIIQDEELLILRYCIPAGQERDPAEEDFVRLLKPYDARIGVSEVFDDLLLFEGYRFQADAALGTGVRAERMLTRFSEYFVESILGERLITLPRETYTLPALMRLEAYDKSHGTDFLGTLVCYFENLLSTGAAAAELHLHRNSMLYRLGKIEEIMGVSLKDRNAVYSLAVSLYIGGRISK